MQTQLLKRSIHVIAMATCLLAGNRSAVAQAHIKVPILQKEWSQDQKPFRIAGNLYYVGTYDLG